MLLAVANLLLSDAASPLRHMTYFDTPSLAAGMSCMNSALSILNMAVPDSFISLQFLTHLGTSLPPPDCTFLESVLTSHAPCTSGTSMTAFSLTCSLAALFAPNLVHSDSVLLSHLLATTGALLLAPNSANLDILLPSQVVAYLEAFLPVLNVSHTKLSLVLRCLAHLTTTLVTPGVTCISMPLSILDVTDSRSSSLVHSLLRMELVSSFVDFVLADVLLMPRGLAYMILLLTALRMVRSSAALLMLSLAMPETFTLLHGFVQTRSLLLVLSFAHLGFLLPSKVRAQHSFATAIQGLVQPEPLISAFDRVLAGSLLVARNLARVSLVLAALNHAATNSFLLLQRLSQTGASVLATVSSRFGMLLLASDYTIFGTSSPLRFSTCAGTPPVVSSFGKVSSLTAFRVPSHADLAPMVSGRTSPRTLLPMIRCMNLGPLFTLRGTS